LGRIAESDDRFELLGYSQNQFCLIIENLEGGKSNQINTQRHFGISQYLLLPQTSLSTNL
jgi:hypothetical protein